MGIGVAGVRALASDSPAAQRHVEAAAPATQTPAGPPAITDPSPVAPTHTSPSAEAAPDPNALTDGVYPTFVRAVDVEEPRSPLTSFRSSSARPSNTGRRSRTGLIGRTSCTTPCTFGTTTRC